MPPPATTTSSPITAANASVPAINLGVALGQTAINYTSCLVELWNPTPATPIVGLQIALRGSTDGGNTYNVPLGGVRTDTGAIEAATPTTPVTVSVIPSAWRCECDNLTNVGLFVLGLTSGSILVTMKAGSFFASQPFTQVVSLLAGGDLNTVGLLTWELDQIRLGISCLCRGDNTFNYVTPPTPLPLPEIYQANTNG